MPRFKFPSLHLKYPKFFKYGALLTIVSTVYFANHAWQSSMGRQAIEDSGLVHYSLEQALLLAKEQNKQVLVNLSAIWCPSCRKLDKQVFSIPAVQHDINASFVYARVDYDTAEGKAFMKRYRVQGFPRLLVLDHNAQKQHILPLTFDPQEFRLFLRRVTNLGP